MNRKASVVLLLAAVGCGRYRGGLVPEPETPNAALAQFMSAIKAKDTRRLEQLWGNEDGTMLGKKNWPDSAVAKTVTLFQIYFQHQGYRIVDGPTSSANAPNFVTFHVELQRANRCTVIVPIDLQHTRRGGWLVFDPHIEAAGNPARPCGTAPSGTGP